MGNKISSCFGKKVVGNEPSRLPLLKLPQNAIEKVLLSMDPVDLITFSLCTNSTSQCVASLQLLKLRLTLQIDRMGNKISAFIENKVVRNKPSGFLLLKLPSDAINNVILTMNPVDLITFSLCTKSTKRRIASLQLKNLRLTLKVGRNIIVETRWPDNTIVKVFLLDANSEKWAEGDNKITKFSGPNNAVVNFGPADDVYGGFQTLRRREWKKKEYEMRCWLEHFQKLFGEKFKRIHFFPNSKRYDILLLEATIDDFFFPMLKLPTDALNNVILTMDPVDLITFSLCTDSTKRRVASLQLKKMRLTLIIDRCIIVEIRWPDNTIVRVYLLDTNSEKWAEGDNKITEFLRPHDAAVNFGPPDNVNGGLLSLEQREWKKDEYEMGDWLKHFEELSNFKHVIFFPNSVRYDSSLLENTIDNLSFITVDISPECTNAHVQDLHRHLLTLERLWLTKNPYDASADFQRFINRNFDMFSFDLILNPTLEDLLVSNAKHIWVKSTLSSQVINRFLKLWAKGGNRRMVWLIMHFPFGQHPEMTEVLKGTEHKLSGRRQNVWKLKRRNGSSGTLQMTNANGWVTLMLFDVYFEKYLS